MFNLSIHFSKKKRKGQCKQRKERKKKSKCSKRIVSCFLIPQTKKERGGRISGAAVSNTDLKIARPSRLHVHRTHNNQHNLIYHRLKMELHVTHSRRKHESKKGKEEIESCKLLLTLKLTFMNYALGSSLQSCLYTVIGCFIF